MRRLGLMLLFLGSGAGLVGVRADAQPVSITPTGINGVINVLAYGAVGDGATDDTQAINAALQAAAGTGATVMLGPTRSNRWVVSSTLKVLTKEVFQGQCGSGRGLGAPGDPIQGSVLLWKGGDDTTVVSFHDVNRSALRCMTIENDNTSLTNLTAILYDSDNNPPSSFNWFEKFYVKGAHIGFACGLTSAQPTYCVGTILGYTGSSTMGGNFFTGLTGGVGLVPAGTVVTQPASGASTTTSSQVALPVVQLKVASLNGFTSNGTIVVGPPTVPGCTEADTVRIQDFAMLGSNSATNADEGIHVNSANCLQASLIDTGNFQGEHIAVHIVNTNGGLRLSSMYAGHTGSDTGAVFLQVDPTVVSSPELRNLETEGNFAYSVHDTACNSYAGSPGSPTWIGNFFNHRVLADGCETITSIGNNNGIGQMTASGTTQVVSINEARWFLGFGQPVMCTGFQASPAEFFGCTGGNGFTRMGTAVLQQPSNPAGPATTTAADVWLPSAVIPVVPAAGFGPGPTTIYLGTPSLSTWANGTLLTNYVGGNYLADACAGTAQLAPSTGTTTVTTTCLAGATVIGVAEITSGTPNALGWSLTGDTLTITSASHSDTSSVAWWRLTNRSGI